VIWGYLVLARGPNQGVLNAKYVVELAKTSFNVRCSTLSKKVGGKSWVGSK